MGSREESASTGCMPRTNKEAFEQPTSMREIWIEMEISNLTLVTPGWTRNHIGHTSTPKQSTWPNFTGQRASLSPEKRTVKLCFAPKRSLIGTRDGLPQCLNRMSGKWRCFMISMVRYPGDKERVLRILVTSKTCTGPPLPDCLSPSIEFLTTPMKVSQIYTVYTVSTPKVDLDRTWRKLWYSNVSYTPCREMSPLNSNYLRFYFQLRSF